LNNTANTKSETLAHIEKKTGYSFTNPELLDRALTHKSFAHESGSADNEKLEFLGDSIIGMIVNEYLYHQFPGYSEGKLSTIKAAVVSKPILARRAAELQLGKYLLLGKGENAGGGRTRPSLLANAFEALAAAIYLDGNLPECRQFILDQLKAEIETVNGKRQGRDYKCLLQEYAQSEYGFVPSYHVVSANGPEHKKSFDVTVSLKNTVLGKGKGTSKKEAEKAAARDAWEYICKQQKTDIGLSS
jgi:ribonuclease-3